MTKTATLLAYLLPVTTPEWSHETFYRIATLGLEKDNLYNYHLTLNEKTSHHHKHVIGVSLLKTEKSANLIATYISAANPTPQKSSPQTQHFQTATSLKMPAPLTAPARHLQKTFNIEPLQTATALLLASSTTAYYPFPNTLINLLDLNIAYLRQQNMVQ